MLTVLIGVQKQKLHMVKGLGYAPQVFVDPEFAATVPCTESEKSEVEVVHNL